MIQKVLQIRMWIQKQGLDVNNVLICQGPLGAMGMAARAVNSKHTQKKEKHSVPL